MKNWKNKGNLKISELVNTVFLISGIVLTATAVFMTFGALWGPFLLLILATMSFYRAGERFWSYVSLSIAVMVILKMASSVLWPIALALIIAFIFLPVVRRLERLGIPRGVSAAVITLGMFLFSVLLSAVVGYQIYLQISDIVKKTKVLIEAVAVLGKNLEDYGIPPEAIGLAENAVKGVLETLPGVEGFLAKLPSILSSSVEMLFTTAMGIVIGFYALKDTDTLVSEMNRLIPDDFKGILSEMYIVMSRYFRGQVTVAFVVGVFVGVGLQVLGIKYGFLIGFLAGVFNLVPNIGFALTVIFGLPIVLLSEPSLFWAVLKFSLVLALDQLLETLVLTPRILGKSVGIHPVLVMLSLIAGATLFGALGVILAVPVVAFLRSLWINRIKKRL